MNARTTHTPSELAETAAQAVVTARGYKHREGEPYLEALGWALGVEVDYETGLALFATATLDVAAASDSPGESEVDHPWAWEDFSTDDSSDQIAGKYILTITCEGEERAVIVHRVQSGPRYGLEGALMQAKRQWAQHIVDALNAQAVAL